MRFLRRHGDVSFRSASDHKRTSYCGPDRHRNSYYHAAKECPSDAKQGTPTTPILTMTLIPSKSHVAYAHIDNTTSRTIPKSIPNNRGVPRTRQSSDCRNSSETITKTSYDDSPCQCDNRVNHSVRSLVCVSTSPRDRSTLLQLHSRLVTADSSIRRPYFAVVGPHRKLWMVLRYPWILRVEFEGEVIR